MATCIDGLYRENYNAGVSLGYYVRDYLPLHLSAFEVAGRALEDWCKSCMGLDYSSPPEPEGWFEEGHHNGVHIWSPPPDIGLIALNKLARS